MAKYYRNKNHKQVVTRTDDGPWTGEETVIVLPEAEWRRLVELYALLWDGTGRIRTGIAVEIDALIAKVEAENA